MARPTKPEGTTAARIVAFRLTPADEALLEAIVETHVKRLAAQGIIGSVRTTDVVRTLIRREGEALGLVPDAVKLVQEAPVVAPAVEKAGSKPRATTAKTAKPKAAKTEVTEVTPDDVRAAVRAAVEKGSTRADIVKAAGVDQGQFSAFMSERKGFSTARLEDVFRAARKLSA